MKRAAGAALVAGLVYVPVAFGGESRDSGTLQGHKAAITDVALNPGGDRAYSADMAGTVCEWDLRSGTRIASWKADKAEVYSLDVRKDGLVASVGHEGTVVFSRKRRVERSVKLPRGWALAVRFSPDGSRAAAVGMDGTLQLIDADSGKVTKRIPIRSWPAAMAWSPDGRGVAVAWNDIVIWDTEAGTAKKTLKGHTSAVRSLSFSPDGKRLVSASIDKTARLWDVESGSEKVKIEQEGFLQYRADGTRILQKISMPLLATAYSPDGRTVATAGADRMVRVWDAESGELLDTFEGHRMSVTGLRYSSDGRSIVSCSLDRTLRTWHRPER